MAEAKYYTPSIEEFHVGFEYEVYDHPNWKKVTLTSDMITTQIGCDPDTDQPFTPKGDINGFRVKYLDREDIESFGFKYEAKTFIYWYNMEGYFNIGTWTSYEIKLFQDIEYDQVGIIAMDGQDKYELFVGRIKNKSELKKILSMVVIPEKHSYEDCK